MCENGVDVKQISIVLSWHDTCPMVKDDGGIGGYEEGAGEQKKMSSERGFQKLKLVMIIVDDAKKESSMIDQRWVGRNNIRPCPNIIAANIRKQQKHSTDLIGLFVCVGMIWGWIFSGIIPNVGRQLNEKQLSLSGISNSLTESSKFHKMRTFPRQSKPCMLCSVNIFLNRL